MHTRAGPGFGFGIHRITGGCSINGYNTGGCSRSLGLGGGNYCRIRIIACVSKMYSSQTQFTPKYKTHSDFFSTRYTGL